MSTANCKLLTLKVLLLKDIHENLAKEISIYLQKYNELGAKINKYIQYVDREWK
jgi:hypothetical protein